MTFKRRILLLLTMWWLGRRTTKSTKESVWASPTRTKTTWSSTRSSLLTSKASLIVCEGTQILKRWERHGRSASLGFISRFCLQRRYLETRSSLIWRSDAFYLSNFWGKSTKFLTCSTLMSLQCLAGLICWLIKLLRRWVPNQSIWWVTGSALPAAMCLFNELWPMSC